MRCAVYIRVSTDKEEQKSSIINQKLLFEQYVKEKNWSITELYIDVESGTTPNRENLKRLIDDMPNKKFDAILAKELSRLSRNGALSYSIRDLAELYDIKLITLDGAINMLENSANMFGLYTWIYESEAQKTSDRVKIALSTQAKQGNFMGSTPPFGYLVKDKKLIIRSDFTPNVVRKIFNDYLNGEGYDKIAKNLTIMNVPTPSALLGKKNSSFIWHGSTVCKILENQHYIGNLVQGKETTTSVTQKKRKKLDSNHHIIVKNTHEAIIPPSIFFAVQNLMQQRKIVRPAAKTRLFSNLLFCKDCGKGMHYRSNRSGYTCGTYSKYGVDFCTSHLVKENMLYKAVLDDLNNLLKPLDTTYILENLEPLLRNRIKELKKQCATYSNNCKKVQKENDFAYKKFIAGTISRNEYTQFINLESQDISLLEEKLSSIQLVLNHLLSPNTLDTLLESVINQYVTCLSPSILNTFISKIEVGENNVLYIHYNFFAPTPT